MNRFLAAWFCILVIPCIAGASQVNLLEKDLAEATAKAAESGKYLYVAFLGDGWSVSSKRFQSKVLDSAEFKEFAEEHVIYCPVMARSHPRLGKKQTARLQSLVIHLDVKAYPTFILIAPDGKEILRHGYRDDTANEYINLLKALLPST